MYLRADLGTIFLNRLQNNLRNDKRLLCNQKCSYFILMNPEIIFDGWTKSSNVMSGQATRCARSNLVWVVMATEYASQIRAIVLIKSLIKSFEEGGYIFKPSNLYTYFIKRVSKSFRVTLFGFYFVITDQQKVCFYLSNSFNYIFLFLG